MPYLSLFEGGNVANSMFDLATNRSINLTVPRVAAVNSYGTLSIPAVFFDRMGSCNINFTCNLLPWSSVSAV